MPMSTFLVVVLILCLLSALLTGYAIPLIKSKTIKVVYACTCVGSFLLFIMLGQFHGFVPMLSELNNKDYLWLITDTLLMIAGIAAGLWVMYNTGNLPFIKCICPEEEGSDDT